MKRRNALALAGLVVGLAILTPSSALAKAGGTDRPVKGTVLSGTASVNLRTGAIAGDFAGVSTHIGNYTVHSEGTSVLAGGTLVGNGTSTIVAANGDLLTGTFTISTADTPAGHTATQVITITGGSGRFADATGIVTATVTSNNFSLVGDTVVRTDDKGTTVGEVSY